MLLRRDIGALLNLIRTHAILHQTRRDKDAKGQIIASLDDYAIVRELVVDLISEGVETSVRPTIRETVNVVESLVAQGTSEPSIQVVAKDLGLDKSAAWRRVRAALDAGYLKNREEKRGLPARLAIAEPLPEDVEILPCADAISPESGCRVATESGGNDPSAPFSDEHDSVPAPREGPEERDPAEGDEQLEFELGLNERHPLAGVLDEKTVQRLREDWELVRTDPAPGNSPEKPQDGLETPRATDSLLVDREQS